MSPVPAAALLAALAAAALLADRTISVAAIALLLLIVCLRATVRRRRMYLVGAFLSGLGVFLVSPFVASYGSHVLWSGPTVPVLGRLDETRGVTLERRHQPRRQRDREHRVTREPGRLHEPIVVEQQRVGGEGECDGGQAEPLEERLLQLLARDVEAPEHRDRRPAPDHMPPDGGDERGHHEDGEPR